MKTKLDLEDGRNMLIIILLTWMVVLNIYLIKSAKFLATQ